MTTHSKALSAEAKAFQVQLAKAKAARSDPGKFLEFVMREEETQSHVRLLPHQKVMLEFVVAHPKCVVRLPADHSKTFTTVALGLWLTGENNTHRGAMIGSEEGIAAKPLKVVRDYIESSAECRLVYPDLMPSDREGDPWTQAALTVKRPIGIKDPTWTAVGIDGQIIGSRINFALIDDILNRQNTATPEQRKKVLEWVASSVLPRLLRNARCVLSNTSWHPQDLTHVFQNDMNWPTLEMDILGEIRIFNTDWDSDDIAPWEERAPASRLAAVPEGDPLWAARYPIERIEEMRDDMPIQEFNRTYRNLCRDDGSARCKQEWIDTCLELGRKHEHFQMVSKYEGENLTFTGLDLAISQNEGSDDTAFFTFEQMPDGMRKLLDIEVGKFDGPTIITKILAKQAAYGSIVRVENNACQGFIRQFALAMDKSLPITAHTTGRNKAHPEGGVESLFIELKNGAWIIPNRGPKNIHPAVERWIEECLYYTPGKHTGDVMMAAWFAREQARKFGLTAGKKVKNRKGEGGGIGQAIAAR